jgi:tryptophan synthase alpha chain
MSAKPVTEQTPVERLRQAFPTDRPAFLPYFTLGYPDMATSLQIIAACAEAGADLMELGIPFSDPLADGPTIQHSTSVALTQGATVRSCLEGIQELRSAGIHIPLIPMGYYNPILAYGEQEFVRDSLEVGANGFIVPDLPPEEAGEFEAASAAAGLGICYLVAPNSPQMRLAETAGRSTGFTYLVSVTGTTGARDQLPSDLVDFVDRVRPHTAGPLAIGFGISTPAHARRVGQLVEGVIVGSALVKVVDAALADGRDPAAAAGQYVQEMAAALR